MNEYKIMCLMSADEYEMCKYHCRYLCVKKNIDVV